MKRNLPLILAILVVASTFLYALSPPKTHKTVAKVGSTQDLAIKPIIVEPREPVVFIVRSPVTKKPPKMVMEGRVPEDRAVNHMTQMRSRIPHLDKGFIRPSHHSSDPLHKTDTQFR